MLASVVAVVVEEVGCADDGVDCVGEMMPDMLACVYKDFS